jgi:hypothetical protein
MVAFLIPLLWGEIIDRIAITIGRQVITELQIDEELRVTALLNHQPIARDAQARRAAADRLIEQLLIKHEMELSHYPLPNSGELENYLQQVRADFGSDAQLHQALATYHVSEQTLRDHLAVQLTTLRFVELRFRPSESMSEVDSHKASNQSALMDAHTDQILNTWLQESRRQTNIAYLDKSLQ